MLTWPIETIAGESVQARAVRVWETALADGPMGYRVRPDDYANFINATTPAGMVGKTPVVSIASWATSCAIGQRAALIQALRAILQPQGPAINASGIFVYLDLYETSKIWVPNDGKLIVQPADIPYWANTGTDGHVEMVRRVRPDGTVETAGGGGGSDGTMCSLRTKPAGCLDPYGRHFHGVWRIDETILPPSPEAAVGERVDPAMPPDSGLTGRAVRGELLGVVHHPEFDVTHPDILAKLTGDRA